MKKLNLGIITAVAAGMVFFACKKEPNVAPETDKEVQTSIDVSFASFLISDIEMIVSWMGEDDAQGKQKFYVESPANTGGGVTVIRNLATRRISFNFNNTLCADGHVRSGTIYLFYKWRMASKVFPYGDSIKPGATPPIDEFDFVYPDLPYPYTGNENYIRDYNFGGRITLEDYRVDDWLVDNEDYTITNPAIKVLGSYGFIYNLRKDNKTPVAGYLHWTFSGSYTMKKGLDSMAWKGSFTKTLDNTSDIKVFATNAQSAINWSLATVSYAGEAKGYTPGNVPYSIKYYSEYPLRRNFTCFPDKVSGVELSPTNTLTAQISESHPFTSGVASFTTGNQYPREIYFDNTENTFGGPDNPTALPAQCDHKATVQIKGIFYPIDLRQK